MMTMVKFPSIEQFRNAIHQIRNWSTYVGNDEDGNPIHDHTRSAPTLSFRGTVKLHGTNAGVVVDLTGENIQYQSRSRILTLGDDNAGFVLSQTRNEHIFRNIADQVAAMDLPIGKPVKVAIFGEWCGGSIQSKVALNQLEKMFVVFAVKAIVDEETNVWVDVSKLTFDDFQARVFNIHTFPTYKVDIDFQNPEVAQNRLIELTMAVEAECPVAKFLGVEGIGEGIVWQYDGKLDDKWNTSKIWFKVKGEKHSGSKVKKLASINVEEVENMRAFVEMTVTESRLNQCYDVVINEMGKPAEMSSLGEMIRWMIGDVVKEESDTIVANQLDPKKLNKPVADKVKLWYIAKLDELVNL